MNQRRYDIDAVRVLAFAVLILYHLGMYYVAGWEFHLKSATTFKWLQDIMILTNPWRMSLLFFISGIVLALTVDKYSISKLVLLKSQRLFIPLLFGMFVIVSPQVYIEALSQNLIETGFWSFWIEYINPTTFLLSEHHSAIGLLTWNHLWFLPYLWVYCIIVIIFRRPLTIFSATTWLKHIPFVLMIFICMCSLMAIWWLLGAAHPSTHDLINDWYNHGKYFLVFLTGYIFAVQKNWWHSVINQRSLLIVLAVVCYVFIIADRHNVWTTLASLYETKLSVKLLYAVIHSANHWLWILAVVGYAGYYLNNPSTLMQYANRAILPCYILHQTLIVVFAWWLKPFVIHPAFEALLLLVLTVSGCYLGYKLSKQNSTLHMLFGVQSKAYKPSKKPVTNLANPK